MSEGLHRLAGAVPAAVVDDDHLVARGHTLGHRQRVVNRADNVGDLVAGRKHDREAAGRGIVIERRSVGHGRSICV